MGIEALADRVEEALGAHYVRTSDQPDAFQQAMLSDSESAYYFEREGEPVVYAIADAAGVEEEIAQALLDILAERHRSYGHDNWGEEDEFDPDSQYERRGPNDIEVQLEWSELERSLRSETRFFNRQAEALLERIFTGIETFQTRGGRPVIRSAGPGTDLDHFWRARVFHRDDQLELALEVPDRELGPPPSRVAVAGRMNARGVSLFYGATEAAAAHAEVRPPVGSRLLYSRFDVMRPLRLLDIDALRSVYVEGSIFDSNYMQRLELAKFLGSLSRRITLPVLPDDEADEYLITQVIADYLATNEALAIDGLLYPSVQLPGEHQNVVLFRSASRVDAYRLPKGTLVSSRLHDYDEGVVLPDYSVSEAVPPRSQGPEPKLADPFDLADDRIPALRLALDTLAVLHVDAVRIDGEAHAVRRLRFHPQDWNFVASKESADEAPDF